MFSDRAPPELARGAAVGPWACPGRESLGATELRSDAPHKQCSSTILAYPILQKKTVHFENRAGKALVRAQTAQGPPWLAFCVSTIPI